MSAHTSLEVVGRHFPALMKNGTPLHRQVSIYRRRAANVSTVEFGSTPGSLR